MQYSPSLAGLFVYQGVFAAMASPFAITIYSGSKPSAAGIAAAFASYNSGNANFLAHYVGATWAYSTNTLSLSAIPAAVNASNTGTGTWCILWGTNPALGAMNAALPTTIFTVGDVSDAGGVGILRFSSTAFTSGVSKVIIDGSLAATMS